MNLLVTHGGYHCASCQMAVQFESADANDWNAGQLRRDGSAVGACLNSHCEQYEKRFRVVLPTIGVEPLPRKAEWEDISQTR